MAAGVISVRLLMAAGVICERLLMEEWCFLRLGRGFGLFLFDFYILWARFSIIFGWFIFAEQWCE